MPPFLILSRLNISREYGEVKIYMALHGLPQRPFRIEAPRGRLFRAQPMDLCLIRTCLLLRLRSSASPPWSQYLPPPGTPLPRKRTSARRRRNSLRSRATSAPEASLKLDAIESGYAVPLTRLNLHVWCIDLSIRPWRSAPRAREVTERAQSIERERSKEPTDPLLWADEAASRAAPIAFGARGESPNETSRRGGTEAKG